MALDISPLLEKRFAGLHLFVACFALCCASSFATYQFNLCVYSICICDILYAIVIYIYIYICEANSDIRTMTRYGVGNKRIGNLSMVLACAHRAGGILGTGG